MATTEENKTEKVAKKATTTKKAATKRLQQKLRKLLKLFKVKKSE